MKILIPASILLVLVCIILGGKSYDNIHDGLLAMGLEEAEMAASIAKSVIDGDALQEMGPGFETTTVYEEQIANLREIRDTCGIAFLYLLYEEDGAVYYGLDTDETDGQLMPGEAFEVSYEELKGVFGGEDYLQESIDVTENGILITAYKAITNSQGSVVAVLGCDYDASGVQERLTDARNSVIQVAVLCLAVALLVLNLIVIGIMRGLRIVDGKIYDLVHNEGDLTQKLDVNSADELELIADSVNALLEHIRSIMLNIKNNSEKIGDSSDTVAKQLGVAEDNITDITAITEQMSAAMEETNASLVEVESSVADMNMSITAIYEKADAESKASDDIVQKAESIYNNAVKEQQEARVLAKQMADTVNEKIEKSKAVEEINKLTADIIGITSQTKLLALNASIEAARAGEAGKGFAVVAEEIGTLATNSAEAASQISEVSHNVILAVDELAGEAEKMLYFMEETAMQGYEKLLQNSQDYQNDVANLSEIMKNFAIASKQLKDSISSIKESVDAVGTAAEESTQGVMHVAQMAVALSESMADIDNEVHANADVAKDLNAEVNKFKI